MHPALNQPYEQLTPDNCVMVFIDHQMGLMLATQSIPLEHVRRATLGLAEIAQLFDIPAVITTGGSGVKHGRGLNGPVFPELPKILSASPLIERTSLNAWQEPKVVEAVQKTGKRKIVMSGVSTDVCLTYATISAADAGYEVYFVTDASPTWDARSELGAMMRMTQRGVIMTNWRSVAAEIQGDWEKRADTAEKYAEILGKYDAAFQGIAETITANGGKLY